MIRNDSMISWFT